MPLYNQNKLMVSSRLVASRSDRPTLS